MTSALEGQDIVLTKTVNLEVGENQNATEIPLTVTSVGNNLMNVDEAASTEPNQNAQPRWGIFEILPSEWDDKLDVLHKFQHHFLAEEIIIQLTHLEQ